MNQIESLVRGFARAGVPLQIADRPFARVSTDEIVQMDVRRTMKHGRVHEDVLLWPGKGADLQVTGTDSDINQLVLRVREARRKFYERRWSPEARRNIQVERWTSPDLRRFLVGMDEAHLFVAQLTTPATTVADAHRGLRPMELEARPEAHRQGEWFFVPASAAERESIRKLARVFFSRNERIGGRVAMRGRPHFAEQLVRMQVRDDTGTRFVEFVRGRVRHPDHAVLDLKEWMRVLMNTENRAIGSTWVD
jgi:hypothetical protein